MLTLADLKAIRQIVREEIERASSHVHPPARDPDELGERPEGMTREEDEAMAAWVRASVDRSRNRVPDAVERELETEAHYKVVAGSDDWYHKRARKRFGKGPDEPVTVEEMMAVMRERRSRVRKAPR